MFKRGRQILLLAFAVLVILALTFLPSIFSRRGGAPSAPPPSGRIRTAEGVPPPPEVRIVAFGESFLEEVGTDPDGSFRFGATAEGAGVLEVRTGSTTTRVPVAGGPVEITLPRAQRDPPPGHIDVAGRLVEGTGDLPVGGAVVRVGEREAVSDERGRFRIGRIPTPGPEGPHLSVHSGDHRPLFLLPPGDATWDDLFLTLVRR